MNSPDDNAARLTLKIAGVFQEVRDTWVRRLENYFGQLESLVSGQWIEPSDMIGLLHEARSASREALDGLGTDLSAELVHESRGVFGRFESEREALLDEINDLRSSLAVAASGDEGIIRMENTSLRRAIMDIPEYRLLEHIRNLGRGSYKELVRSTGYKMAEIRKYAKSLMKKGYISIHKSTRPHTMQFISAPWKNLCSSTETENLDSSQVQLRQLAH